MFRFNFLESYITQLAFWQAKLYDVKNMHLENFMSSKYPIQKLLERMRENWPEVISPESDIVFGIIRFNDLIRARTDKVLSTYNLSRAGFEVLASLRSMGKPRRLTPKELSDSILLTTGGMTKVLIYLEKEGLIELGSNDQDKRSKLVKLTPAGEQMAELSMEAVAKQDRELFQEALSSKEIATLNRQLLGSLHKVEKRN